MWSNAGLRPADAFTENNDKIDCSALFPFFHFFPFFFLFFFFFFFFFLLLFFWGPSRAKVGLGPSRSWASVGKNGGPKSVGLFFLRRKK